MADHLEEGMSDRCACTLINFTDTLIHLLYNEKEKMASDLINMIMVSVFGFVAPESRKDVMSQIQFTFEKMEDLKFEDLEDFYEFAKELNAIRNGEDEEN